MEEEARKRKEAADRHAQALHDAKTTIHRVYNYAGPLTDPQSIPAKLIGVDIELEGFTESFDVRGIHVTDGVTGKNYGDLIDGGFMTPEGAVKESGHNLQRVTWPDPPGPVRVLLVFALPTDSSNSIQVKFVDQLLTPESIVVEGTGPALRPNRR